MEIYLLRHGIAEEGQPGNPDSDRELTDEGREKTAGVMKIARHGDVSPSLILSSPYARARQTAKIAAEELGYKGEIGTLESLLPHVRPEEVWADVRDHADEPSILLAGHEPQMSTLVAYFLNAPSLRVEMKKSALVRIDADAKHRIPHGLLRWMLTAKFL